MPYVKLLETSLCVKRCKPAKFFTSPCNINRLYKILWAEIIAAIKANPDRRNTNICVVNRKDLQMISATWRIKLLGVNLLPSLCSALQRTLKQLGTRFYPLKLSERREITLHTVGNVGQLYLASLTTGHDPK